MSGNILDQMERDRKKALNQAQKSIANPTVQANKAVQNAYNPAKVQNTVQKIGQSATKINNTINKPVVNGVNNMNKAVNNGVNNINKPVNALNRNAEAQRAMNVERQLDELEAFNRDMKRDSVADTVYNNTAQSNYNRQMANNAIMANRQTINNSPSNWSNTANNTMSEEEKQLANIEAFNNEVVRPARGLNLNNPANLGVLAKTINNVPIKQNVPEGYNPNVDYAAEIDFAIKSGAPWQEIEKLYQMRDYKKSTNPEKYGQYDNDEYDLKAQKYINENSMIDRLYDGQTDLYNQSVDLGLQNKLDALKLQGEQNKAKYDDIRSQAYSNARLSAIGNNEAMASMGLAGGLYSSPTSGYSETSRMAQDNNLRGNISSADRQEQEQLEELQALENEERRNAEAEKLSYLASMGDKKAQATLEKYYYDKNMDYQKGRDEVADSQFDRQFGLSERQFAEQQKQNNFANELSLKQLEAQIDYQNKTIDFERYKYDKDYRLAIDELAFKKDISYKELGQNQQRIDLDKQAQAQQNALAWANHNLNKQKVNNSSGGSSGSISGETTRSWSDFTVSEIESMRNSIIATKGEDYYNWALGQAKEG